MKRMMCAGLLVALLGGAQAAPRPAASAGPRFPELALSGNAEFSTERLRRVLDEIVCGPMHTQEARLASLPQDVGEPKPCKSPEDQAQTLATFYLRSGYVLANVRVTGPEGREVLEIIEGPRFHVGAVTFAERPRGKDALGAPRQLAAAFAVPAGVPFSREVVVAGQSRLEDRYRRAGYPEVLVTIATQIDAEARSMALTVEIERGPRRSTPAGRR